ncbi:MAG: cobalt ECF transporter T component CbiQ [Methanomassiliicoccaceae archaeon]|nr:cobalt ECF transporter T component CbiQ [Methanomassiliicoccaceae archaeon]
MSEEHGSEFNSVDTAAYKSPMLSWSPLAKLFLILSLLVLDIASKTIWMSVFACAIGLTLFLYASSLRPPKALMLLFVYAQVLIIISAFIFMIVTPGASVASWWFLNFTDAGISFAMLIYARATAALLLLYSFAVSTPVPHLAEAMKKLRFPDVFVELMVLMYRYTFLLMETAEKMHLVAECKFGYAGYKKSMSTTSKLAVGVFMRSLDTAERGQVALQCRNYRGEFKSLSSFNKQNKTATVFCALIVCTAVIFFLTQWYGVLPI